nr:VOC family protein [Actinomadura sp. CNU-125]
MITNVGLVTVWCLDQDSAKDFFTGTLGLEPRDDITLGEGGMRWVTVGAKDQPDLSLTLMVPGPPTMDAESGEQMKKLIAKGVLGAAPSTPTTAGPTTNACPPRASSSSRSRNAAPTASKPSSATTPAAGTASPSPPNGSTNPPTGATA